MTTKMTTVQKRLSKIEEAKRKRKNLSEDKEVRSVVAKSLRK